MIIAEQLICFRLQNSPTYCSVLTRSPTQSLFFAPYTTDVLQLKIMDLQLTTTVNTHLSAVTLRPVYLSRRRPAGWSSHIEQSDWPRGEETDVEGPGGLADWSAGWSDDSETECFYSNGLSEASSAFIISAVLNGLYEGRDGVVRRTLSHTCVPSVLNLYYDVNFGNVVEALEQKNCGIKWKNNIITCN